MYRIFTIDHRICIVIYDTQYMTFSYIVDITLNLYTVLYSKGGLASNMESDSRVNLQFYTSVRAKGS